MQSNDKKKICIVVSSLGKGGAERTSAIISKILVNLGYEVHIVTVLNRIDYEFGGKLLNLGLLKDKDVSFFGKLNRFKVFKAYLKKEKFDLIIDSRSRPTVIKEFLINKLLYKGKRVLYLVHSWKLSMYFSSNRFISKIIYKNALGFVAVSEEIKKAIQNRFSYKNVSVIYNSVDINQNSILATKTIEDFGDFILFYGRLDDRVKNISLLINAYKNSVLPSKNIKLMILGSGKDLELLKKKASSSNIMFKPFTNNPFPYIKQSRFLVLTSRFEGFPLVLLESLSIEKPVISVNCKSGPAEIIKHAVNGFLVENNSSKALSEAMNNFIFDEQLYEQCSKNAIQSIERFSVENIAQDWKDLIETLI